MKVIHGVNLQLGFGGVHLAMDTLQCLHRPKKQNPNFMVGTDCFLVHIYWSLGKNFVQLEFNVSHFVYLDWALELFIVLSGCNHVSINLRSTELQCSEDKQIITLSSQMQTFSRERQRWSHNFRVRASREHPSLAAYTEVKSNCSSKLCLALV